MKEISTDSKLLADRIKSFLLTIGDNMDDVGIGVDVDSIKPEYKKDLHEIAEIMRTANDSEVIKRHFADACERPEEDTFSIIFSIGITLSLIKQEEGPDEYNRNLLYYVMAYLLKLDKLWNGEEHAKNQE